jgi:methanol--5-hydroxybenzimidazolylcobamide Co-methyltransferase
MSMEGKTSACAHSSPVGNIAAATGDLWSNESVQNVKLLGGMAPQVSLEQLIYDCRLMNTATRTGQALLLRDLFVESDARLDPQAYVLAPDNAVTIGREIVESPDYYTAGKAVILKTIALLRKGRDEQRVHVPDMELFWLDTMEETVTAFPDTEDAFIDSILPQIDTAKCAVEQYDIHA